MPVQRFDPSSGLQWLKGIQTGQGLVNQLITSPIEREQLSLANQLTRQKVAAQPETLAAQLAASRAGTALTQEKTKFAPLTAAMQAQSALNDQQRLAQLQNRFSGAYQLRQWLMGLSPSQRATWVAKNPKAYATLGAQIGNKALMAQHPRNAMPQVLTKELIEAAGLPYQGPEESDPRLRATPPGAAAAALPRTQAPQPAVSTQPAPLPNEATRDASFNTDPDTVNKLAQASALQANKDLTNSTIEKRREAGEALDNLLNAPAMRTSLQTLAQFQSAAGRGKAYFDRVFKPGAYAEYEAAYQQMPSIISGSLKSLEGFGATDAGMQQGIDYFKMSRQFYKSDPGAAIKYFNLGIQKLNAESEALKQAASPLFPVSRAGEKPIALLPSPAQRARTQGAAAPRFKVPEGQIGVTAPDGSTYSIPANQWQEAQTQGYRRLK